MARPEWSQCSPDEVLTRVTSIVAKEFSLEPSGLGFDTRLVEDLDFDSIDGIDLAIRVEEEMGVKVEEDQLGELRTLRDVVDLVRGEWRAR